MGLLDGLNLEGAALTSAPAPAAPPMPKSLLDGLGFVPVKEEAPIMAITPPREAKGFVESVQAGFQGSAPGLMWRQKLPDLISNPEHASWWERAATGATQVAAELPLMIGGAMAGAPAGGVVGTAVGGPVGGAVGTVLGAGFGMGAVPAAIRTSYIEALKAGEVKDAGDYWNILREAAIAAAKEGGINAAAMGAGALAGRAVGAAIAPGIGTKTAVGTATKAIEGADIATQIALMPTIPAVLAGRLPALHEYGDAAIIIFGMKGAHEGANKIMRIYERTGKTPAEQVADAQGNPKLAEEMAAPPQKHEVVIPRTADGRVDMPTIQDALFAETARIDELALRERDLATPLTDAERAELVATREKVAKLEEQLAAGAQAATVPVDAAPRYAPEQLVDVRATAEARIAELDAKAAETALTDTERAQRVFLKNSLEKPEALAMHFKVEPAGGRVPTAAERQASAQRVYEDVLAQVKAADEARRGAGLEPLGDAHADAVAMLVRARVRTRAARLGRLPEEIYNEKPLQIRDEAAVTAVADAEAGGATPESDVANPPAAAPEVDLFGDPIAPPAAVPMAVADLATQEVPLANLVLSKEVPQFKNAADANGVVAALGGKFDRTGVGPIQVWERLDGTLEVISGRHRLDLARRSGEQTIPAQIHREADGFDARQAATLDAQLNIREEQGSVADYAQYFKDAGISKEAADERGLLARAKGRTGFAIARDGSADLLQAHRAGKLTDEAALAISAAAPGSDRLQALGMMQVTEGKSILFAVNTMRAVDLMAAERLAGGEQGDIFGFDDSAMREASTMAKRASSKQRAISEHIAAVSGASKRPELARKMGVNVEDPEGIQKKIAELRQEQYLWDNWPLYPELVAKLRELNQAPADPTSLAFQAWFGKSKVVDEDGEPLVVYHGTATDFDVFKARTAGAIWFAADPGYAGKYGSVATDSNKQIIPVYLTVKNPLTVDMQGGADLPKGMKGVLRYANTLEDVVGVAKQQGHDGVIFRNRAKTSEGFAADEYAVFKPEQIKSAIGNHGTFDPNDPNILRQDPVDLKPETPAEATARDAEAGAAALRKLTRERTTETAAFRAWFGESKVLDEARAPRIVYHGTPEDLHGGFGGNEIVGWFSESPDLADRYSIGRDSTTDEPNVLPVYLAIKNPVDLTVDKRFDLTNGDAPVRELFERVGISIEGVADWVLKDPGFLYESVNTAEFEQAARRAGYDGIKALEEGHVTWAAFEPTQIKSAIGNRGTFDARDPNILHQSKRRVLDDSTPLSSGPFAGVSKDQFLGDPKITKNSNAADLRPIEISGLADVPREPFLDNYEAKFSPDAGVVFDGDKVIASYSFGDTLVVDKAYRRSGIAEELVYQWRMRNPDAKPAGTRTKAAQAIQEKVWDRIRTEANEGTLSQDEASPRGSYQIAANLITTLQGADKSTVVHELGHSWLEEMKADAARSDAPLQVKTDWDILRAELAIGADGKISRESHEQWARTVERYLAEGEAPSVELRGVFERFKAWLLEIYQNLGALKAEVNPELKGILDRMLATDEEIAAARDLEVPRSYVPEAAAAAVEAIVPPPAARRKIEPGFAAEKAAMEPYADELPSGPGEAPDNTHVNYAYINTPTDVKLAMQRMAEIDQANIQAQRGGTEGVKSWAEANAEQAKYLNDILGGSADTLHLFEPRDPNAPHVDVRLGILKKLAVGAAKDSARLRDVVLGKGHDATVREQLEYLGSIERARMIQAEFLGERASVARALNALKDSTEGTGEIGRMLEAIGLGDDAVLQQAARTPAEEQAYLKAQLDQILLAYKGRTVLDIAKLHKEIGTLKGTFKLAKEVEKATTWEQIIEGWRSGLLSGPVTHTTNLFGTGAFHFMRAPVDALASVIGMARGASPGMGESDRASMSEAVARLTGMMGGIQDGLKIAYHTFNLDDPTGKTEAYRTAIPGRAGELIRIPLRLMGAEDALVSTMYRRGELHTLAIRQAFDEQMNPSTREFADRVTQLLDHPTPEMEAIADAASTRMTFNMPLGEKGVALQGFVNKWNLQWMLPFIRTPINIAKELLRMSPFAPAIAEWRADFARGGVARDRALAEITAGTAVMAATMAAAFAGNISGNGSPDPGKNRAKVGVWQPYSVLVGDTWYEYARIQPTGTLMGMAADMSLIWDQMTGEEKDKTPKLLAAAFANAITNQTFLAGITNVVNATSDPVRFGPRFLQQFAGSLVPNVIGQPTTMADPVVREVNSMLEAIQARIPGLRQDLLPKVDWLGDPVLTKERLGLVMPVREQKVSEDKVRLEADRLELSMAAAPKKTHIGKGTGKLGDVELTPQEKNVFATVGGQFAHKILENIVNAPGYDEMPDLVKRQIFGKVLAASHRVAAVAALPPEKRLEYLQSITEKVQTELTPGVE